MVTHLRLWAEMLGSLPGPLRFGVGALVLLLIAVLLGAGLAILDHLKADLMERRLRLRFSQRPSGQRERQHLAAVVQIADRRRAS